MAKITGYTATVEETQLWCVCKWNTHSYGTIYYTHKHRWISDVI